MIFNSIWNRPGPWKIDISTSQNYFSLNPLEKLFIKNKKNTYLNTSLKTSLDDMKFKPGFKKQIEFFFYSIKNKKKLNYNFFSDLMKTIHKFFYK